MENLKTIIRNMGKAGIPVMGYCFTVVGAWGRHEGARARGGATAVGYIKELAPEETPIPNGTVWNMVYDPHAPPGNIGAVSREKMWSRLEYFLGELVPVAEEAGVRLAAHPDDPPLPTLRGVARLIHQPQHYQQLLDLAPSPANALEFCVGTLAEMTEGDIYDVVETYSRQGKVAYVHLRNVHGKVPNYHEVFIDEGDTDMFRVLSILHRNRFDGVIIPDHTPQMTCPAPWHAGMAYALGWIRATIDMLERS
jgi:mannonate dehydratase